MRCLVSFRILSLLAGLLPLTRPAPVAADEKASPRARTFLFTYRATVTGLPAGKIAHVWLPVPPRASEEQQVTIESADVPEEAKVAREPVYGNFILYVPAKPDAKGTVTLAVTYLVTRREVRGETALAAEDKERLARFLQPDAKVPLTGKPLTLLDGKRVPSDQFAAAKLLYDVVNGHMRYSKEGTGWGQGDAVWACDSKTGNCSDFHSLFISLARARQIPAKFEMGFPLPEKRGAGEIPGYHCWAGFRPDGKGWVPVDISEANKNPKLTEYFFGNLTEDRVAFSTGRDIDLVPKQAAGPLNFFIYPHVEVDGKVWPAEKVGRQFTFKDMADKK